MSAAALRATLATSLTRYARSWGLWFVLLVGPVGARFMVARDDGSGVQIAIDGHLLVLDSAVLGVSLGVVVSTLLLPIGFLYLRSNVTRRQPWQVAEVTAASRVALALGRFAADAAILLATLATLTLAGWLLGWLILPNGLDPLRLAWPLWLIAAPALIGLAAIHRLLDAWQPTRRGWGDTLFFCLWLASLAVPISVAERPSSFAVNLADFAGFIRPFAGPAPAAGQDLAIGSTEGLLPGRVRVDVMAGIGAPGYGASRGAWIGIALVLVILAGLLHQPHVAPRRRRLAGALARWLAPGAPPPVDRAAPPAPPLRPAGLPLVAGEFRLIGAGRLFPALALAAAAAGLFGDYRHFGSPAALLLLIFALVAHAGRSEAVGLLALTRTAPAGPWARRIGFVAAGGAWAVLLAVPASLVRLSPEPLLSGAALGSGAALIASGLATLSHSGFAARLVLLALWYAYLSS